MTANFIVTCPHCGHENECRTDTPVFLPRLIFCDAEWGGCDEPIAFTAKFKIDVEVAVFTLEAVNGTA